MTNLSLEDLLKTSDNIYEAVSVMTKRARQINDEQKIKIEMERDVNPVIENRDNEDFEDVEIDREALMREYEKIPKPTTLAIEEMFDGHIHFEYMSSGEEKE